MINNMERVESNLISVASYDCNTTTIYHHPQDLKSIPRTVEVIFELPPSPVDPNQALVDELRGKVLRVPCMLKATMDGWPVRERNPWEKQMRVLFNDALDRVIPDARRRQKFKDCDFAFFCSLWWPHGAWDDFYAASFFALWIFIWDDTIDSNDHDLSDDFRRACRLRKQTLAYCKYQLGLSDTTDEPQCPSDACGLFTEFSGRIVRKFKRARVQRIYDELVHYVTECENEQHDRLMGRIPTLDEYMENRLGTAGVRILCAFNELFLDQALPDWMMNSPEMEVIWRETDLAIIIINDVLSLMKEMVTGCMISLIPVLYRQGVEFDAIVPELMDELRNVRERFDEAAESLERACRGDRHLRRDLKTYLDICRMNSTGTYIYTIESKRYKIAHLVQEDGSVVMEL